MKSPDKMGSVLAEYKYDFLQGKAEFPFALLIAQHVTEEALTKILVERFEKDDMSTFVRGMKMIGMSQEERRHRNGFLVSFEDGRKVWSQYIVGADGSRSVVSILTCCYSERL